MKLKSLAIDLQVEEIELTEQDINDFKTGKLSPLDFDCHFIFLTEDEWQAFKNKVNAM
jgi:hypothetical protein